MNERKVERQTERHEAAGSEAAPAAPDHRLLGIQRKAGNAATLAMLGAQAKLTVGAANDPAEREADAIARQVVASLSGGSSGTALAGKAPGGIARLVHRRSVPGPAPVGPEGGEVDGGTEHALQSAMGSGAPMAEPVRRSMETAFGADFSGVRVHTGSSAESLSRSLGAEAFTTGSDVFFRSGMPDTSSKAGQELLAHELAHTVQQGAAPVARQIQREPAAEEEKEAEGEEGGATPGPEAPEAKAEEHEGGETETEEGDGKGVVVKGSLPPSTAPAPAIGPPPGVVGDRMSDRSPARRRGASGAEQKPSGGLRLVLGDIGLSTKSKQDNSVAGTGGQEDGIQTSATTSTSIAGGLNTGAFGSMQPSMGFRDLKYEAKTGATEGNYIKVSFTLFGDAKWGVTDGGLVTDVPSGTAPVITAENYTQIVSDLSPKLIEQSWRAPRTKFWSEAICARHEKYHANDFTTWLESQGKTLVQNELQSATVALDEKTRQDQATIETETAKKVAAARIKLFTAFGAYMQGSPVASYLSMPAEKRAFGDGKAPYEALAAEVQKHGEKLAAEKKAKSTPPTKPETAPSAPTPPT